MRLEKGVKIARKIIYKLDKQQLKDKGYVYKEIINQLKINKEEAIEDNIFLIIDLLYQLKTHE